MADTVVVSDPRDELRLRDAIADTWRPGTYALRVEPTPAGGKDRLAEDVLTALHRRPRFAFRWSDRVGKLRDAAWLWCHAHRIQHVVVPRAHTLQPEQLSLMTSGSPRYGYVDVEAVTWWLIDSSAEGTLTQATAHTHRTDPDGMLADIARADTERERLADLSRELDNDDSVGADVRDAHPAVFMRRLEETLSGDGLATAVKRFTAAAMLAREMREFDSDVAALWYLLANARDPADALVVLRGAQLGFLQRRRHLSIVSDPWVAAEDARRRVAADAEALLPYVDAIVAAIGALAIAGALSPGYMASMRAEQLAGSRIALHPAFEPADPHPIIAAALRAQSLAARTGRGPGGPSARPMLLRPPGSKTTTAARVSADRINAVLREIELERGAAFSLDGWRAEHSIRWQPV